MSTLDKRIHLVIYSKSAIVFPKSLEKFPLKQANTACHMFPSFDSQIFAVLSYTIYLAAAFSSNI